MKKKIVTLTILIILMIINVNAINESEINNITESIVPIINQSIHDHDQEINDRLNNLNISLSDEQMNSLIKEIRNINNSVCDLLEGENTVLNQEFQKILQASINNEMDQEFLDHRSWIEKTWFPVQERLDELEDSNTVNQQIIDGLQQEATVVSARHEAEIIACDAKLEGAGSENETAYYIIFALVALIALLVFPKIKHRIPGVKD